MLGFGRDDEKEKLKENMEEIKDLIDRDSGVEDQHPEEFDDEDFQAPSSTGQEESPEEFDFPDLNSSAPEPDERPSSSVESDVETRETGQSNVGRDLNRDIPEPAETRELNVPDIDKGPLFIRRQKFEKALQMIEEMFYLSREVEDTVNQLESGLQRDRETEKELRQLIQGVETDRSEVEKIVSPGEE